MKQTLVRKFIIIYILLGLLMVLFISTMGYKLTYSLQFDYYLERTYDEVNVLASSYKGIFSPSKEDEGFDTQANELHNIARFAKSDILFLKKDGSVVFSTNPLFSKNMLIPFDPTDSGSKIYLSGFFYDSYDETMISIHTPVLSNYNTVGYVIMHFPKGQVIEASNDMLRVVYTMAIIFFILSLLLMLVFHILVTIPMRKVTQMAKQYASGNLSYENPLHTNDEIGYLSSTLYYMASELDRSVEEQRSFIANVSHDFRSPLTSIRGYLEAILDGTISPENQGRYLTIVLDETERLNKLTQSLLDLNSINQSGMLLELTNFDINHTIKKVLATFEGQCKARNISFDLTFDEDECFVFADSGKIKQVLYNLIDNAIKFSHDHETIYIKTRIKPEKTFISIKDKGVGIPSDSITKVFDRFFKVDTSRGRDKKGTGLGLAIAKDILTAHTENIDVISTEGVGTEFIFTLPTSKG